MVKLMTDLDLDNSSDQMKDEVENHNNCATKSKESLKLNKSGKVKKKRDVTKNEIEIKVC
jgi:lipid II:glycine glycyltransferase (peptidoglycan interpeptide bridge formation enzyme)